MVFLFVTYVFTRSRLILFMFGQCNFLDIHRMSCNKWYFSICNPYNSWQWKLSICLMLWFYLFEYRYESHISNLRSSWIISTFKRGNYFCFDGELNLCSIYSKLWNFIKALGDLFQENDSDVQVTFPWIFNIIWEFSSKYFLCFSILF